MSKVTRFLRILLPPHHVEDRASPVTTVQPSDLMKLFLDGLFTYEQVVKAHETVLLSAISSILAMLPLDSAEAVVADDLQEPTDPASLSYLSPSGLEVFDGLIAIVKQNERKIRSMQQELDDARAVIRQQHLEIERLKAGVKLPVEHGKKVGGSDL
jgi:hypothetical protein